ncbi:MAG: ABC transporter substrate-binding protein [Candidatus Cloacimonetes bacterium]|jgi:iron complex transport system substrate-binding protein|nr:ABC transporter substrate-binding protein [Candidatus Cloacimonadota bacterium]
MKRNLILLVVALLIFSGCSSSEHQAGKRYIVTSPEIAEIIYLLQGVKNIVGVTIECDYPAKLNKIEKVGNFGKVDYEKIISLDPSIVFTSGLEQELLTSELEKLQIPTAKFYPNSIDDMILSIREIGKLIGVEERANFVADSLMIEIEKISQNNSDNSPQVYVEIYNNPIMSVSDKSFVGEVIQISGGDNVFAELPRDYSRVKAEDVINADPEIIILTCPPEFTAESIKIRKGWEVISAVKNDRIYTALDIDPDLIIRATPRIVEGMKQLQKIINDEK